MRETDPFVQPSRAAGDASTLADEASTPASSFLFPVESGTGQKAGETMARFFARRERSNQETLLAENDDQKKRRVQREENAAKGRAPGKKGALVFVWELRGGNYIRTPGGRNNYEDLWDEYSAAQRRYDSFRNEWDLCEEFDQVETEVDCRPIKMVEDDDDDDDDMWQMLPDTLPTGFNQIDPSASVADLNRMHPLPLPSVTTESPTVIKTSSDMVEEAVYRRFGCDLGLQQEKIQSARTLPKDLVNDLNSIPLLDFNCPTSRINSDWKMDVKRFEAGASSADQKQLHYLVQEVDNPGPLFIIVTSATTVLEIIRQNWGPSVGVVTEYMLARGMPFHLCAKSSRCLFPPPAPVADPWPINSGLGYRGAHYTPTDSDYRCYEAARTRLLLTERGQVALRSGGLIARIASDVVSVDRALLGPSDRVTEQGVCFRPGNVPVAFWDEKLTEDEENLICGVYYVATGKLPSASRQLF
ncbi:hypothetical protein C8F04DRAFT_952498 [Mycena alexandri]|uniref:Uncharacterized protein n=1 Tax=Mycena alexandri TaxID=1745969 RepID=A0AAD6XA18_9AGAR|nr:hypothetical protein C8F04DRAFT_952498 [Mycena alexandri]